MSDYNLMGHTMTRINVGSRQVGGRGYFRQSAGGNADERIPVTRQDIQSAQTYYNNYAPDIYAPTYAPPEPIERVAYLNGKKVLVTDLDDGSTQTKFANGSIKIQKPDGSSEVRDGSQLDRYNAKGQLTYREGTQKLNGTIQTVVTQYDPQNPRQTLSQEVRAANGKTLKRSDAALLHGFPVMVAKNHAGEQSYSFNGQPVQFKSQSVNGQQGVVMSSAGGTLPNIFKAADGTVLIEHKPSQSSSSPNATQWLTPQVYDKAREAEAKQQRQDKGAMQRDLIRQDLASYEANRPQEFNLGNTLRDIGTGMAYTFDLTHPGHLLELGGEVLHNTGSLTQGVASGVAQSATNNGYMHQHTGDAAEDFGAFLGTAGGELGVAMLAGTTAIPTVGGSLAAYGARQYVGTLARDMHDRSGKTGQSGLELIQATYSDPMAHLNAAAVAAGSTASLGVGIGLNAGGASTTQQILGNAATNLVASSGDELTNHGQLGFKADSGMNIAVNTGIGAVMDGVAGHGSTAGLTQAESQAIDAGLGHAQRDLAMGFMPYDLEGTHHLQVRTSPDGAGGVTAFNLYNPVQRGSAPAVLFGGMAGATLAHPLWGPNSNSNSHALSDGSLQGKAQPVKPGTNPVTGTQQPVSLTDQFVAVSVLGADGKPVSERNVLPVSPQYILDNPEQFPRIELDPAYNDLLTPKKPNSKPQASGSSPTEGTSTSNAAQEGSPGALQGIGNALGRRILEVSNHSDPIFNNSEAGAVATGQRPAPTGVGEAEPKVSPDTASASSNQSNNYSSNHALHDSKSSFNNSKKIPSPSEEIPFNIMEKDQYDFLIELGQDPIKAAQYVAEKVTANVDSYTNNPTPKNKALTHGRIVPGQLTRIPLETSKVNGIKTTANLHLFDPKNSFNDLQFHTHNYRSKSLTYFGENGVIKHRVPEFPVHPEGEYKSYTYKFDEKLGYVNTFQQNHALTNTDYVQFPDGQVMEMTPDYIHAVDVSDLKGPSYTIFVKNQLLEDLDKGIIYMNDSLEKAKSEIDTSSEKTQLSLGDTVSTALEAVLLKASQAFSASAENPERIIGPQGIFGATPSAPR